MNVLGELVLLADRLDRKGLRKEADFLDQVLEKMAAKKKPAKKKKDQDGDGDNDFKDVMMARMKASGMSDKEADEKAEKHDKKPKASKKS